MTQASLVTPEASRPAQLNDYFGAAYVLRTLLSEEVPYSLASTVEGLPLLSAFALSGISVDGMLQTLKGDRTDADITADIQQLDEDANTIYAGRRVKVMSRNGGAAETDVFRLHRGDGEYERAIGASQTITGTIRGLSLVGNTVDFNSGWRPLRFRDSSGNPASFYRARAANDYGIPLLRIKFLDTE